MAGAPSVRVKLVGPDARELRDDAGQPWRRVQPGEEIDVIPEQAGRPPGEWAPLGEGQAPADDGQQYRVGDDGWEVRDPGVGLLAQPDLWAPAEMTKRKPASAPADTTSQEG